MDGWDESLHRKLELKARKAKARYADLHRQLIQQHKQRRTRQWQKRTWQLFIIGLILALMDSCKTDYAHLINQVSQQVSQQIHLPLP